MFRSPSSTVAKISLTAFLVVGAALFLGSQPLLAADNPSTLCNEDVEVQVSIGYDGAVLQPDGTYCVPLNKTSTNVTDNPIVAFLKTVLQFLALGIGIALVGGLSTGGVVYMTARANPQQVQKAEEIIRNAIIGIALYVFMFAIINFLIPGGLLT
jgi:hypothetical protein